MTAVPEAVDVLAGELAELGWVSDLLVAGSLATGDYRPFVSDLDLVAITEGPVPAERRETLAALHRKLDDGAAKGLKLGCVYVDENRLADADAEHPTWTHGRMVQRILSGITRAELARHGFAVRGRDPGDLLPASTPHSVRVAARAELTGYWAWAARRPWIWLDPELADLGLTSMARGRHALATGDLLTKSRAIEESAAPGRLKEQLRARRSGTDTTSPRWRTAWIAWTDCRRTVKAARNAGDL
ncbi:nucleotidyltransferase domain-containing protein [Actinoplanes sp. NPDC023714]|uniref:nucleotidyltransferase domain-containing protein n=1 Tax=Actinoplanes sp. NPDC023714 TaxID=3154322 RepID=UPI0033F857F8